MIKHLAEKKHNVYTHPQTWRERLDVLDVNAAGDCSSVIRKSAFKISLFNLYSASLKMCPLRE